MRPQLDPQVEALIVETRKLTTEGNSAEADLSVKKQGTVRIVE